MANDIRIRRAAGSYVIRAGGAVLGETKAAHALAEGAYPEVLYFPREDLAMAMLEPSETRTTCPFKGAARYYSIHIKSGVIEDAGWSYESPVEAVAQIKGLIAFDPAKVTIEAL